MYLKDNSTGNLTGVVLDGKHYIDFYVYQTLANTTVLEEAKHTAQNLLPPEIWQHIQEGAVT